MSIWQSIYGTCNVILLLFLRRHVIVREAPPPNYFFIKVVQLKPDQPDQSLRH